MNKTRPQRVAETWSTSLVSTQILQTPACMKNVWPSFAHETLNLTFRTAAFKYSDTTLNMTNK